MCVGYKIPIPRKSSGFDCAFIYYDCFNGKNL